MASEIITIFIQKLRQPDQSEYGSHGTLYNADLNDNTVAEEISIFALSDKDLKVRANSNPCCSSLRIKFGYKMAVESEGSRGIPNQLLPALASSSVHGHLKRELA
ncbi:hypothetical protein L596_026191 [Steinernema carpocapsae]|uniref:Uncharacterized protein n=1 Tax=Steinernema carpocapsae TaxID=34508 RepID=A0A4U5M0N2_STECR|nr:hypothetical protein L596_026191 [Steinernema carpocapsae]